MPKERSINPAQAQRKADKQKEIAKSKKTLQTQRNEKLARRNPERVQRQVDELKELESRGNLRPKDRETLAQLERDLRGIRRAREALGDAAPTFPSQQRHSDRGSVRQEQRERRQNLGKRRRSHEDAQSSDTDPEVRDIPMPRDTPPPVPRQRGDRRNSPVLPENPQPLPPARTVYSSAPQMRDLKKEAVQLVPSVVAHHKKRAKGEGRLLEPEEFERLEKAGYYAANKAAQEAGMEAALEQTRIQARAGDGKDKLDLDDEMRRFEQEMNEIQPDIDHIPSRHVQMEEVEDAGD